MYDAQNRRRTGISSAHRAWKPFDRHERTVLFASSATVPACLDLALGGPARWPARGLVRPV